MSNIEHHKARHVLRDRSAGGVRLGVLDTKSKHFRRPDGSESASLSPQQTSSQLPSQASPAVPTTGPLDVDLLISSNEVSSFFSSNQTSQASDTAQDAQTQELNADYFNLSTKLSSCIVISSHVRPHEPVAWILWDWEHVS